MSARIGSFCDWLNLSWCENRVRVCFQDESLSSHCEPDTVRCGGRRLIHIGHIGTSNNVQTKFYLMSHILWTTRNTTRDRYPRDLSVPLNT